MLLAEILYLHTCYINPQKLNSLVCEPQTNLSPPLQPIQRECNDGLDLDQVRYLVVIPARTGEPRDWYNCHRLQVCQIESLSWRAKKLEIYGCSKHCLQATPTDSVCLLHWHCVRLQMYTTFLDHMVPVTGHMTSYKHTLLGTIHRWQLQTI